MRQVSGTGSDDDGTDLRKRENVARQRSGDNDTMLPGSFLLQRAQSAGFVTRLSDDGLTIVRTHGHAGHGTALMMMMLAVP